MLEAGLDALSVVDADGLWVGVLTLAAIRAQTAGAGRDAGAS
jgi:hypothetical protein